MVRFAMVISPLGERMLLYSTVEIVQSVASIFALAALMRSMASRCSLYTTKP